MLIVTWRFVEPPPFRAVRRAIPLLTHRPRALWLHRLFELYRPADMMRLGHWIICLPILLVDGNAGCNNRTDDVPTLIVPSCSDGVASFGHFYVSDADTCVPSTLPTNGTICYGDDGFRISEIATDTYIFSPYTECNSPVFVDSDVLEVFIAPVHSPTDNPRWYFELDASPSGVMWGGLSNNSRSNSSICVSEDGCEASGTLDCSGKATFAHSMTVTETNMTGAWMIDMFIPWAIFAPEFQPTGGRPWSLFRVNFYRYLYPSGPSGPFELAAWSPTHDASFHVPERFGVMCLI